VVSTSPPPAALLSAFEFCESGDLLSPGSDSFPQETASMPNSIMERYQRNYYSRYIRYMRKTSDYLTIHHTNTLILLKITQNKKHLDLLTKENIEHIMRM
jgi:hypothetical protein